MKIFFLCLNTYIIYINTSSLFFFFFWTQCSTELVSIQSNASPYPEKGFFRQPIARERTYISGMGPTNLDEIFAIFREKTLITLSQMTQNLKIRICFMQNFLGLDMKKLLDPKAVTFWVSGFSFTNYHAISLQPWPKFSQAGPHFFQNHIWIQWNHEISKNFKT